LFFIIPYLLLLSACDGFTPTLTGSIAINSTPAEAIVYLDGVNTAQTTPTVLTDVSAGTHTVKLVLYLYESKEETNVLVTAGETTDLDWALTPVTIQTLKLQPGERQEALYFLQGESPCWVRSSQPPIPSVALKLVTIK
jgi:hypothetical protein